MKTNQLLLAALLAVFTISCSGKKDNTDNYDINGAGNKAPKEEKASTRVDLESKGVGPITSVEIPDTIDEELAKTGEGVFKQSCVICHKVEDKFIGPAVKGVVDRRSPEWIMNMILEPAKMLRDDPLAKDLFLEFNGSPMSDMGLTEEQARAVLEYFRTL
ncbi:c-type cytochrome [Roseivirga pacifica]|uniref:c-type cytochrome n=1 Tax=Roseivirga pacifica TaxID=1267423 RepID=UPI003BAFCFEB